MRTRLALAFMLAGLPLLPATAQEEVRPSAADPAVGDFDSPSLVYGGGAERARSPLAIFLAGTGGTSAYAPRLLLETIARQGYRVIALTYDDTPAVNQVCPNRPPPCSARFREARSFGGAPGGPVSNPTAEAIVPRLVALLRTLDRTHPGAGWGSYLDPDGGPAWDRLVLSGLSQGAGMAAFIAKRFPVRRIVLFSSPWDVTGADHHPAPWLAGPSATPMTRWWAERHRREQHTRWLADAYRTLGIPANHILLFDGTPPPGVRGQDPYHTTTVRLPEYVGRWRTMYGTP